MIHILILLADETPTKKRGVQMSKHQPSLEDWRELYRASTDFMNIKPWTWMSDSDLFGVQDPQSGEIGYCCIMGELGEVFALALYLGSEGLEAYLKIQSSQIDVDNPDLLHIQRCLMASWEDRESLEKADLQTIRDLGLRFRGRNAWPRFRSFLPGYVPWFLTKQEARFLTVALQQATGVALRFRKDAGILNPPGNNLVLVRIPGSKGKNAGWKDAWLEPPPQKRDDPVGPVDEIRVQRIKKNITIRKGTWEIDFFYFPVPVQEGGRPYFPPTGIIMEHSRGLALHSWLASPWSFFPEFLESLLSFIEEMGILPKRILVSKPETVKILWLITSALKIDLKMVEVLEAVDEFRREMDTRFFGIPGD